MAEPRLREAPPPAAGVAARAAAAAVVAAVRHGGRSLNDALTAPQILALPDGRDRSLVRELSYGTLRMLPRLEALTAILMHKPVKAADRDIEALVLIGLYQLVATRIPSHAAVAATVAAAKAPGKPWAAGLVNALLRRFERERADLDARIAAIPRVRWLFPDWLLHRLRVAWPEHWAAICDASNAHPPMTLRVNRLRTDRRAYAELLATAGIASRPLPFAETALRLDRPVPTDRLPGFDAGLVSVQDGAAQLAAVLLDAQPGDRVLDACAAPGGKTAHIIERAGNDLDLNAVDLDPQRLDRVTQGLIRLGLRAHTCVGDVASLEGDWARGQYRRILLDVPCSATGVIRRHPDIKWLRRDTDVHQLADLQRRILDAVWSLLAPGGVLLYATCSLLPEENELQIAAFMARTPDAKLSPITADWGQSRGPGRQILPGSDGMDGFFYARLEKTAP